MAYDTYSATNSGPADQHSTLSVGDALSDCSPIHFTYPDLTAGNYSFTTQADELPAIPELDSLPAGQAEKGVFEPSCPYYNGASSGLPKFRVAEYFVDGLTYIGDSYGGRDFIGIDDEKSCSANCRCRRIVPGRRDFPFIAYKTSSELRIAVYDPSLYQIVAAVTDEAATLNYGDGDAVIFDGFVVLAKYAELKQRLDSCFSINQEPSGGALTLNLLVGEFLTDPDIFRTFGFENLYERGYLPFELWNTFQRRQLDDDVTLLDDSFNAYADEVSCYHLDQGVDLEFESAPLTTLRQAASCGDDSSVRLLLNQGVNVDLDDGDVLTPLVAAALGSHDSTVRLLLDWGARIDGNGLRSTALEKAAKAGHESTARLLLSRGASVEGIGFGLTPMTEAAARGCESMVRLLLDWGADIEGKRRGDPRRCSEPLEEAAAGGYDSTVRLLLDRGARCSSSALRKAAMGGHESTVRLLLDSGAISPFMALEEAAAEGNESAVRLLLDQGVSVEGDELGSSPLKVAAAGGHEALVRLLLDRGASVEGNGWGLSPLKEAAAGGHEALVRLLLDRGAAIENHGWGTYTPLGMAVACGHKSTVGLLRGRGARKTENKRAVDPAFMGPYYRFFPPKPYMFHDCFDFHKEASPMQFRKRSWPELAPHSSRIGLGGGPDRPSPAKNSRWRRTWKEIPLQQTQGSMAVCYRAFIHEFEKVKNTTLQDDNATKTIQRQFSDYRTMWQSGIRTLRNISDGRLPQDLGELLAFLCVCKATSETLDLLTASEYTVSFFADLPRWGIVFGTQWESDLYKDAVRAIWGVDFTLLAAFDKPSDLTGYSDLMMYSQGMALSLTGAVGSLIGRTTGGHTNRLEQSQKIWRERHRVPHFPKDETGPAMGKAPDIPLRETSPLQSEISSRVPPAHISPKLAILWMGAIFAILLIFLSWLRNQLLCSHTATVLVPSWRICPAATSSRDALMGCCEVVETYLGLSTLKHAFEAAWTASLQSDEVKIQQTSVVNRPFLPPGTSESIDAGSNVSRTSKFVASAHGAAISTRVEVPSRSQFCEDCRRPFLTTTNYLRHRREVHERKKFRCKECGGAFTRRDYLMRHSCRDSK